MKAIVTGGAGFIGSWVVDYLIDKDFEVVVIDNLSTGNKSNLNEKAKFYEADIRDEKIAEIFETEKPDYVFHLAAQINVRESIKDPLEDSKINILGALNILNACVKNSVKKIIFSSTGGAIYGDGAKIPSDENEKEVPLSPYGVAKLSIEKYMGFYKEVHGLDYCALRYSNVFGPRQNSKGEAGVVSIFATKILEGGQPVINGDGLQTRDYVYVKDVAKANILALDLSGIFNVGTGIETDVNVIFNKIVENLGTDTKEVHADAIAGEMLRSCLNAGKLIEKGWGVDYDLDMGMKETVEWFKNNN